MAAATDCSDVQLYAVVSGAYSSDQQRIRELYEFRLVSKPRARIMISRNHQIGKLRRGSGAGLEPTTSSYPDQCSNHLSYPALRHSNSPIRQFHDNTAVSISTHLSAVCLTSVTQCVYVLHILGGWAASHDQAVYTV